MELRIKSTGKTITAHELFSKGFGYADNEVVYFRIFEDNEKKKNTSLALPPMKLQCRLSELDSVLPELKKHNSNGSTGGVYFVVNGGGNTDNEVIKSGSAKAQFFEIDSLPFSEQEELIRKAPLKPSAIFRTAKSYHTYYFLKEGSAARFRGIQSSLAVYFGGDSSVKNESRVMRVPGFYHNKHEPVMVEVIYFNPEQRYTQGEIMKAYGSQTMKKEAPKPITAGEPIAEGNRNKTLYVMACRLIDAGLMSNSIYLALNNENRARCENALSDSEITSIIRNAYKYKEDEPAKAAYRKQKRKEVIQGYET